MYSISRGVRHTLAHVVPEVCRRDPVAHLERQQAEHADCVDTTMPRENCPVGRVDGREA